MRQSLLLLVGCVLLAAGCERHPFTDYRVLDKGGMWSSAIEQLKALNTSDTEVAQIVKLKNAGLSDDTCVALVAAAHEKKHPFNSADAAANMARAGFLEPQILEIARFDQLDVLGGEAVALKLISLPDSIIRTVLQRRLQGKPVLGSSQIARLKNTGLSERDILQRINRGMTDAQAEKEAGARESARNHSGTGFVRMRGRRPR